MIVGVAIQDTDGVVHSLPSPKRHNHVIREMAAASGDPLSALAIQGFVDDEGNFLNRTDAAKIAVGSGQIPYLRHPPNLYSEDLW